MSEQVKKRPHESHGCHCRNCLEYDSQPVIVRTEVGELKITWLYVLGPGRHDVQIDPHHD